MSFGPFELQLGSGELRKHGTVIPLQDQPFEILRALLETPGQIVPREELRERLWRGDTFVDFEHGLNAAIKRLRDTLGDDADHPRYVETVPRRGYRFIAPLGGFPVPAPAPALGLEGAARPPVTEAATSGYDVTRSARPRGLGAMLAGAAAATLSGVVSWLLWPTPSPAPAVRALLELHPADELNAAGFRPDFVWTRAGSRTAFTWLPGGRLAFVGRKDDVSRLYVRDLQSATARPLTGTEGAQVPTASPDGASIVFWTGGEIKRVPVDGGPASTIISGISMPPLGMAVAASGRIALAVPQDEIVRIAQVVPGPRAVLQDWIPVAPNEALHLLPRWLDDSVMLFTARTQSGAAERDGNARIVAHDVRTGDRKVLLEDAADGRYVPSGRLVFLRRGKLMGVPFDPDRLQVLGEPVALVDGVAQALSAGNIYDITMAGQFGISDTGTLAYVPGLDTSPQGRLARVDRAGRTTPLPGGVVPAGTVDLSPDGSHLMTGSATVPGLWDLDLARGGVTRVFTEGDGDFPRWTPDGRAVAFPWVRNGRWQLALQRLDDGSAPQVLLDGGPYWPSSWSPDGRHLAFVFVGDLWTADVGVSGQRATQTRLTETPESEGSPEFSPDGRWLAYSSDRTGRPEVYVRPYPGPGAATLVSVAGGTNPTWTVHGREILFIQSGADSSDEASMVAVPMNEGRPGIPQPLFSFSPLQLFARCAPNRCYAASRDGRFIYSAHAVPRDPPPPVTHLNVVVNWLSELDARIPSRSSP